MRKGDGLFTQERAWDLHGRRVAFAVIQGGGGLSQVVLGVGEGVGVFLFGGEILIQRNSGAKIFWEWVWVRVKLRET